jgi:hypothetical protein
MSAPFPNQSPRFFHRCLRERFLAVLATRGPPEKRPTLTKAPEALTAPQRSVRPGTVARWLPLAK